MGEKTVQKLLKDMGSLERVRESSVAELSALVGPVTAQRILDYFTQSVEAQPAG